jgi:hypothetical protein
MKVIFTGVTRDGLSITSNSIIQKEINNVLYTKLCIKGHWINIINESLIIKKNYVLQFIT